MIELFLTTTWDSKNAFPGTCLSELLGNIQDIEVFGLVFIAFNKVLQEKGRIIQCCVCASFPDRFSNLENTAAPRGSSTEVMCFHASEGKNEF